MPSRSAEPRKRPRTQGPQDVAASLDKAVPPAVDLIEAASPAARPLQAATAVVTSTPPPPAVPLVATGLTPPGTVPPAQAVGAAAQVSAAPASSSATAKNDKKEVAFLRLSKDCIPSKPFKQVVYLDEDEVSFGRIPTCTVVMESARVPQMISRTHAYIRRKTTDNKTEGWVVSDNSSLNGVFVNGQKVPAEGAVLQHNDVVTFGRKIAVPEFEFIFECHGATSGVDQTVAIAEFEEQSAAMKDLIGSLEQQLEAERKAKSKDENEAVQRRQKNQTVLAEFNAELHCSICQDWLVHSTTVNCSHTFCGTCIDAWLMRGQFHCPECRQEVVREPVRTRAVDSIVQKAMDQLEGSAKADYAKRLQEAEANLERSRRRQEQLNKSVSDAIKQRKAFFHISAQWNKNEKEVFKRGIKDYIGDTRETYCKLTGFTVQWIHSAREHELNTVLHNLGLTSHVSSPEADIRQRLLMFLRYG